MNENRDWGKEKKEGCKKGITFVFMWILNVVCTGWYITIFGHVEGSLTSKFITASSMLDGTSSTGLKFLSKSGTASSTLGSSIYSSLFSLQLSCTVVNIVSLPSWAGPAYGFTFKFEWNLYTSLVPNLAKIPGTNAPKTLRGDSHKSLV